MRQPYQYHHAYYGLTLTGILAASQVTQIEQAVDVWNAKMVRDLNTDLFGENFSGELTPTTRAQQKSQGSVTGSVTSSSVT